MGTPEIRTDSPKAQLLIAQLASMSALFWSYPFGIPKRICTLRPTSANQTIVVTFLVPTLPLPAQQLELLNAAAQKGLLLDPQQYEVRTLETHQKSAAAFFCACGISALSASQETPVEEQSAGGKWLEFAGKPTLCTQDLELVVSDPVRKRLLWQDLKSLRARLPERE